MCSFFVFLSYCVLCAYCGYIFDFVFFVVLLWLNTFDIFYFSKVELVENLTPNETSLIPLLTSENKIGQYIFPITYMVFCDLLKKYYLWKQFRKKFIINEVHRARFYLGPLKPLKWSIQHSDLSELFKHGTLNPEHWTRNIFSESSILQLFFPFYFYKFVSTLFSILLHPPGT